MKDILSVIYVCSIVAVLTILIVQGLYFFFPDKELFYWKMALGMLAAVFVIRKFNRMERK